MTLKRGLAWRSAIVTGLSRAFFEDFLVDVRADKVRLALGNFSRTDTPVFNNPVYTFDGIERRENRFEYSVRLRRNGLLNTSQQLPLIRQQDGHQFSPTAVDILLRHFVSRASAVYEAADVGPPYVLGMMLRTQRPLTAVYAAFGGGEHHTEPAPPGDYRFPYMQLDDLSSTDRIIRPFCDQAHQMFGRDGSSSFNRDGVWVPATCRCSPRSAIQMTPGLEMTQSCARSALLHGFASEKVPHSFLISTTKCRGVIPLRAGYVRASAT